MRRWIGVMLGVAALTLPSVAFAFSRVLHGPVGSGGLATIDVQFNVKHGRAARITRLEMNNVPATCTGFPSTAAFYSFPHRIRVALDGKFHATDVLGGGRVTYMVRGRFTSLRRAKGKLRIHGTIPGCRSADTGLMSWTAKATG